MDDREDYDGGGEPDAHASSHESGGSDELDITGLTPAVHASRHENGGGDEIDASGLTGVGTLLVDRGDPAGFDLEMGAMTVDGTWYDWDVSAIVPAGAVAIEIKWDMNNDNAGKSLIFRKKGNSNEINVLTFSTIVGGGTVHFSGKVFCDSNRVVQYFATGSAAPWNTIHITITGYWI